MMKIKSKPVTETKHKLILEIGEEEAALLLSILDKLIKNDDIENFSEDDKWKIIDIASLIQIIVTSEE